MKTGDLVTIRLGPAPQTRQTRREIILTRYTKGIILDCLEGSDGFWSYEVLSEGIIEWFSDLELRPFDEGR